jgi:hypothetical protein
LFDELGFAAIGPDFDALETLDMMKSNIFYNVLCLFGLSLTTTNAKLISILPFFFFFLSFIFLP